MTSVGLEIKCFEEEEIDHETNDDIVIGRHPGIGSFDEQCEKSAY
jgi:hypothetical protein